MIKIKVYPALRYQRILQHRVGILGWETSLPGTSTQYPAAFPNPLLGPQTPGSIALQSSSLLPTLRLGSYSASPGTNLQLHN